MTKIDQTEKQLNKPAMQQLISVGLEVLHVNANKQPNSLWYLIAGGGLKPWTSVVWEFKLGELADLANLNFESCVCQMKKLGRHTADMELLLQNSNFVWLKKE